MPRSLAAAVGLALVVPLFGASFVSPAGAAPAYDKGLSTPVRDSYYPDKGHPGVDVLHYKLDLTWRRKARTLDGVARLTIRPTRDAGYFRLDLARTLRVKRVAVDGRRVRAFSHKGDHLVVRRTLDADDRTTVRIAYTGTPAPVRGPSSRSDIGRVGMRVTRTGQLWTMQEPYGALTWYPVNDHPSDKALYDVRVNAPGRWVGVSNGRLVERRREGNRTITRFTHRSPMASYLTTLAVGPYKHVRDRGPRNLPISYWVPRGRADQLLPPLRRTPGALRWLERHLGPYPFETAGVVVTPSDSAMETQTLITFGIKNFLWGGNRYVRQVMVHELAHHWYGDTVTPTDWRDLWMNEGMATWLDTRWAADKGYTRWRREVRYWTEDDPWLRRAYGPPGAYKPGQFAQDNVYYSAALMLEHLRHRIGDQAFAATMREWPQRHRDTNQTRDTYVAWLEQRTGAELSRFFDTWLTSERSPVRDGKRTAA